MKQPSLEQLRSRYQPIIPKILMNPKGAQFQESNLVVVVPEIASLFPHTNHEALLELVHSSQQNFQPLRVAILLSGGQAPGGHAVIGALYDLLKELHSESVLIGVEGGPEGILRKKSRVLELDEINQCRYSGGFTLLGTSRKKIETHEELESAEQFVRELKLDGLVIVGGDDSNTNAAILAERFSSHKVDCIVVGVPKTIDGDLQSAFLPISFGFDTACRTYSEMIGNLGRDLLSSKKYYAFVRLMGRSASHITLECALETKPNMALISEECEKDRTTLHEVVEKIVALVVERAAVKKEYGLILIPEGLIESLSDVKMLINELNQFFSEKNPISAEFLALQSSQERLQFAKDHLSETALSCLNEFPAEIEHQLVYERDPHGNVPVSQIETERLLALLVQEQLKIRYPQIRFASLTSFYGYEGRSSLPTNFDCTLCTILGRVAGLLVAHKKNGYMAVVSNVKDMAENWCPLAVPLTSQMVFEERKGVKKPVIEKTKVDLGGEAFRSWEVLRERLRLQDEYVLVGPVQFFGPFEDIVGAPKCL